MTNLKKAKVKAFTLVEMLVVLLIISVLLLLFVPNLTKQKDAVDDKGKAAVVKVVESQAELYRLDKNDDASLSKITSGRSVSQLSKLKLQRLPMQNKNTSKLLQIKAFTMLESLLVFGTCEYPCPGLVWFCSIQFCSGRRADFLYGV